MQLLWTLVYLVTTIYFFILVVRILYSLVNVFVRDWRPRSINLIIAELVMTLTDPPLRFFRRFIPPLRLGQVSLDLSFIVVFLIVMIIRFIALQGATA
ncbi:MAG TPA: YggT family protein [Enteractinococcus helveticum]|uniref:YggT family protein n=1 Tax=Enteractinococcus helveticum TaxID=1837282 RepID=A0A921FKK5_9MICC|nr:YggT family protein [Enteractinococcus helveticum]HJF13261.1 YggT family protein [Enteractinococcus helveticum]